MVKSAESNVDTKEDNLDRQMELIEHLTELRNRIIRVILYVCVGTVVGWIFYRWFFEILSAPLADYLSTSGNSFLLTGVAEGFTIKMQISLLVGIIIALPMITLEAWGFIAPGLTPNERRAARLIGPFSIILFISGVLLGYVILPVGIQWLVSQNPPGAKFMPSVAQTLMFILKMYLAFGLVFQMPIILMFLGKAGLITSSMLKSYWRHSIVIIAITAAVVTPSGDAFTMMVMCIPMVVLYLASIGLVRIVEKR